MFSWNVLWSTVFTLTVMPELAVLKAASTSSSAFFGTGSEALDPSVSVPDAAAVPPPPLDPPQAASTAGRPKAAPAPSAAVLNSDRRPITPPETDVGTIRAKYSASVAGRVMGASFGTSFTEAIRTYFDRNAR